MNDLKNIPHRQNGKKYVKNAYQGYVYLPFPTSVGFSQPPHFFVLSWSAEAAAKAVPGLHGGSRLQQLLHHGDVAVEGSFEERCLASAEEWGVVWARWWCLSIYVLVYIYIYVYIFPEICRRKGQPWSLWIVFCSVKENFPLIWVQVWCKCMSMSFEPGGQIFAKYIPRQPLGNGG